MLPRDGQALLDLFPPEGRAARQALVEVAGAGWGWPPLADPAVWGVTAPDDVAWMRARVAAQPFKTVTQPPRLTSPAALAGPNTLIARARAEPGWRYRELATGHDAMVTMPRETAKLLLELV